MYEIVSLSEAIAKIDLNTDLAFDTETIGFYGKIRLAQFYQRSWDTSLLVENPDQYQLFAFLSNKPNLNIVMQYSSYDISTIQRQVGARFIPAKFNDTFFLARLAFPHLYEYSLDVLIEEVLGHDPYANAGLDKAALQKSDWKNMILTKQQLLYAGIDTLYLLDLYDKVKVQEESFNYKLDMHSLREALDFQRNGLPIDQERCQAHYQENLATIAKEAVPINVNSYKQVRPYINSNESDDIGLIRQMLQGNERARAVRATRKCIKQNSFLDKYNTPDGRIYGIFAPSARSGRYTCSDDNLEQIPRKLKDCIGVDEHSGKVIIYSDFSQLELRSVAAIANESIIYDLYMAGKDLHNFTAERIFGPEFTKEQRQIAKTCNFNLLYGGGEDMLQTILIKEAQLLLDIDLIKRIKRKWLRTFPAIANWQEKRVQDFYRKRLGSTPLGRKYKARRGTDHINIENQGHGADIAKLAMHYMFQPVKDLGGLLCNFIHDAYIIEANDDPAVYESIAKIVAESMREAWSECQQHVMMKNMPMPVSVGVGYNWGDIEAGKTIYTYKIAS